MMGDIWLGVCWTPSLLQVKKVVGCSKSAVKILLVLECAILIKISDIYYYYY